MAMPKARERASSGVVECLVRMASFRLMATLTGAPKACDGPPANCGAAPVKPAGKGVNFQ